MLQCSNRTEMRGIMFICTVWEAEWSTTTKKIYTKKREEEKKIVLSHSKSLKWDHTECKFYSGLCDRQSTSTRSFISNVIFPTLRYLWLVWWVWLTTFACKWILLTSKWTVGVDLKKMEDLERKWNFFLNFFFLVRFLISKLQNYHYRAYVCGSISYSANNFLCKFIPECWFHISFPLTMFRFMFKSTLNLNWFFFSFVYIFTKKKDLNVYERQKRLLSSLKCCFYFATTCWCWLNKS